MLNNKDPRKTVARIAFLAILVFTLGTAAAIAIQSWAVFGVAFLLALLTAASILLAIDAWDEL